MDACLISDMSLMPMHAYVPFTILVSPFIKQSPRQQNELKHKDWREYQYQVHYVSEWTTCTRQRNKPKKQHHCTVACHPLCKATSKVSSHIWTTRARELQEATNLAIWTDTLSATRLWYTRMVQMSRQTSKQPSHFSTWPSDLKCFNKFSFGSLGCCTTLRCLAWLKVYAWTPQEQMYPYSLARTVNTGTAMHSFSRKQLPMELKVERHTSNKINDRVW